MKIRLLPLFAILIVLEIVFSCDRKAVPYLGQEENPVDSNGILVQTDTIYLNDTIFIDTSSVPSMPCSPDSVYFEQQLLPLFQSQCATAGCHDNITHDEGIYMTSYERILTTSGINLASPTNSKLYKSLNASGGDRMPPPPRLALTPDQKSLILKWIQQGAQDLKCDVPCDPSLFTFNAVVKPIVSQRCVGCHGNTAPGGNIKLITYTDIKASVDSGKFYKSITHASGVSPMPYPQGAAKIPDCEIVKISKWIDAGALDN